MSAHQHSPAALRELAEDQVGRELAMVCAMSQVRVQVDSELAAAAFLESFMVHARAMDRFFSDPPNRGSAGTGVAAGNYFRVVTAWERTHVLTESERHAIHRRVARLDCERTLPTVVWTLSDRAGIADRLLARTKDFVHQLGQESPERAAWFSSGVDMGESFLVGSTRGAFVFASVGGVSLPVTATPITAAPVTAGPMSPAAGDTAHGAAAHGAAPDPG